MRSHTRISTVAIFAIALLQFNSVSNASERSSVDPNLAMVAALSLCSSPTQLDCIESISIISSSGPLLPATQIKIDNYTEVDANGQIVEFGETIWRYQTSVGANNTFAIRATITTPKFVVSGDSQSVEVKIGKESEEESSNEENDEENLNATTEIIDSDTRYYEPSLSISALFDGEITGESSSKLFKDEQLQVIVRTSWLKSSQVYLTGKNAKISIATQSGGNRFQLTGSESTQYFRISSSSQLTGKTTYSIVGFPEIKFLVLHPLNTDAAYSCQEKGYLSFASNAGSVSLIEDIQDNSIRFTTSGFKYMADNVLNKGYATIKIPVEWFKCKYPDSAFIYGESFKVKAITNDGTSTPQNGVGKAEIANSTLDIVIDNFSFAKTEVVVETDATKAIAAKKTLQNAKVKAEADARAKAEADAKSQSNTTAQPALAPVKSKKTITCVKGKITKKVKAVNPKCPKGYKKK